MAKADDQVKEAIRVFIREAEKKYNIVRAYIYGSSSMGTDSEWGDIDSAIGFPDPIPPFSGS
jgi:predicted nucleotidyltransferase